MLVNGWLMQPQGGSWQLLAETVLRMAGGVPEPDTAPQIHVLSDTEPCLKSHPPWLLSSILKA